MVHSVDMELEMVGMADDDDDDAVERGHERMHDAEDKTVVNHEAVEDR